MKTGVYLCQCGGIISELIDAGKLGGRLLAEGRAGYVKTVDLACSEDGKAWMAEDLALEKPDRVVIAACSPRDHEETFRGVMTAAGMNPFLCQLVNVREQVAWVTEGVAAATGKAFHQIMGALARVEAQAPLERQFIEVNPDVLVIGGGPAGLKAALTLSEGGRKVYLVEKDAILGGMPLRYEEIFPSMECGPCVLEPLIASALHGPVAENIEVMLTSEVVEVKGSFGNFLVKIKRRPRYVDLGLCIGCAGCIAACPVAYPNDLNCGMGERRAMDFVFFGGLPNAPYLDDSKCSRFTLGDGCEACRAACPVEGAVNLEDKASVTGIEVGSIIVAVGGALYDAAKIPELGYGRVPGVYTSLELERMFSTNGPMEGKPKLKDGSEPENVAIIHCAGSLDPDHLEYCSGICCLDAFKLNALFRHKFPGAGVTHFYRTFVMPGKTEAGLFGKAMREGAKPVRYSQPKEISVREGPDGRPEVSGPSGTETFDMVVLMTGIVPSGSVAQLSEILDTPTDRAGFFEEMQGRVDVTSSKVRGVFIAGLCQSPMDLSRAINQGLGAAGSALSALVPGRRLELEAIYALVDEESCSGCRSCVAVCPYKAISFNLEKETAEVNPALCLGCGTCVAACPSSAITGRHFTNEEIFAEIEGILR